MDYKDVEPYLKKYDDVLDGLLKELIVVKSELEEIKRMINDLGGSPQDVKQLLNGTVALKEDGVKIILVFLRQ